MSNLVLISQQEHMSGSKRLTDHFTHFQDYICFAKHSEGSNSQIFVKATVKHFEARVCIT